MADDRQPKMRAMIMADDEEGRRAALGELLPYQQEDFEGLFEAMKGLPVTIRLLDPPLHEFLANLPELRAQVERARIERHGRPAEAREAARSRGGDPRGEPDAGHARLPAGDPLPGDLRDAGRGDHARVGGDGRAAAGGDHDPAGRLRARARDPARAGGPDRRRARSEGRRGLPRGDDDRAAAGVLHREPDRRARRLLQLRDQRPHADGARLLARRRRVQVRAHLSGSQDHRPLAVRDDRQAGRRLAGAAGGVGGPGGAPGPQARDLRRARRRSGVDRLLPHGRARLRLVLAVPRADRPRRRRAGGDRTFW